MRDFFEFLFFSFRWAVVVFWFTLATYPMAMGKRAETQQVVVEMLIQLKCLAL